MRNLEILLNGSVTLIDFDREAEETVQMFTVDELAHKLYLISSKNILYAFSYSQLLPANSSKLLYQCEIFAGENANAVSIAYIQEISGLCIAFSNGTIIKHSNMSEAEGDDQIDEIACVPDKIITGSWSPNEECFIVVEGEGKLVMYNTLFDIVSSVNLDDNDETFQAGQEITAENSSILNAKITWKSDSRIFAINYSINGGYKCLTRDINMNIIKGPARADKETIDSKDRNVSSVSERPVKEMGPPVSMMPNGSLIAGFQSSKDDQGNNISEIIFWEKNGLRHGQICLPKFSGYLPIVKDLKFNSDTNFLAAYIDFEGDRTQDPLIPQKQIIILYRSNYHWFIKKSIDIIEDVDIVDLHWLQNKKNQLMIIDKESNFMFYEFQLLYQTSSDVGYQNFDNLSYTANVDFTKIMITPFRKVVIPPPMSEKEIEVCEIPKTLCFYSKNRIFVLFKSKIGYIDCQTGLFTTEEFNYRGVAKGIIFVESENQNNVTSGVLLIACSEHNKKKDTLIEVLVRIDSENKIIISKTVSQSSNKVYSWCVSPYKWFDDEHVNVECKELNKHYINKKSINDDHEDQNPTMAMFLRQQEDNEDTFDQYEKCIFVQYLNKKIQKYIPALLRDEESGEFKDLWFELSHLCSQIDASFLCGELCIFSLSNNSKLSINGKLFSKECTSLFITRDFMFFINSTQALFHYLYVYNLNKNLPLPVVDAKDPDPSQAVPKLPTTEDDSFHIRNVERGTKIVCCNMTKSILQMPRGNLEGIRHRVPLLHHAEKLIEDCQYGVVFQMLRKNKINLNLICDINYDKFKANIGIFVQQNFKIDFLNLFISSLSEDESKELEFLKPKSGEEIIRRQFADISGAKQKVNEICDLIRAELTKIDKNSELVLPILTTYVKKNPQELIDALYLVKSLKSNEQGVKRKVIPPHLNPQTMAKERKEKRVYYEDALEYVCWLVDANKLYNVALQTYDLDLVTMVATQTQKDPREFLPYLNSLRQMEPQYMRFKIQFDLGEFEKALSEISKADPKYFSESLAMIKKQRLFRQALRAYSDHSDLLKEIKISFADYLNDRKYYEEAGLMYKYAGEYSKALKSLKETPNYEMLFAVSQYLNFSKDEIQQLAIDYSKALQKDNKNIKEAGIVLAKYHGKGDEIQKQAVDLLIKSKTYFFAIEKACDWDKKDFIEGEIKHGVKLAYELKYNDIEKRIKEYKEKLLRLKIVQHNKKHLGSLTALGPGAGNFDAETMSQSQLSDASLVSGTQSLSGLSETSKLSQARVRMTKSRKKSKQKKKKKAPKEGATFEEEMLVEFLDDINVSQEERDEVSNLMKALVYFGYIDESVNLHEKVENLLHLTNSRIRTIEQQAILDESPVLVDLYNIKNTKYDEDFDEEWKDIRFMKH